MPRVNTGGGKKREIALIHLPLGDDALLVASQGGMNTNPLWYNSSSHYDYLTVL